MTNMQPPATAPSAPPRSSEPDKDNHYLRMLAIGHYVHAAFVALFSLFSGIYIAMGILMLTGVMKDEHGQAPPPAVGWIMILLAVILAAVILTVAGLILLTGRSLKARKRYTFCFVMACVQLLFQPLGILVGIFTILVLLRDGVKAQFQAGQSAEHPDGRPQDPPAETVCP
jgi:hypothetical protein